MFNKVAGRFNDNGDTGLVVSTQKRGAVGDDQLFTGILADAGEAFHRENDVLFFI